MKALVVYGGRFQPPHRGHLSSYEQLASKFGKNSIYMASAEKPIGPKDPFAWTEKKKIAVAMGIPSAKFVKLTSVYNLDAISGGIKFNPKDTVVILALSAKDASRLIGKNKDKEGYVIKKDGSRAAIQEFRDDMQPASSGHMYAFITETETFKVGGQAITGATEIRAMYTSANDKQRARILNDLYGSNANATIQKLYNKRLSGSITESFMRDFESFVDLF